MSSWDTCCVPDSIIKTKIGKHNQILAKEINGYGKFPVIDQGQSFIAGYADDKDKLIKSDLPLIVFGDHTRIFKFVDFPFILGADGTKILKPNGEMFHPKFFYFALISLNLPSKGYNRHFKLLKEKSLPYPPLSEQKKIAHILSTVQKAIEAQEKIIQTTTELKKALMQKLFTEGLRGEKQKQTEIGPIPESWEVKKVTEISVLKSGGTPSRKRIEYWKSGEIPWVKTGEVNYCTIYDTEEKITKKGLKESSAKLFPAGTLLMAMYGQGITRGKVALLGTEAATNQACAAFFPSKEVDPKYLYFFFEYKYDDIRNFAHGANQKNLSANLIKTFPVTFPKNEEDQKTIVNVLFKLDRKILNHRKAMRLNKNIFRTLLHQLMVGNIRTQGLKLIQK